MRGKKTNEKKKYKNWNHFNREKLIYVVNICFNDC